jgi:hypothetical protein
MISRSTLAALAAVSLVAGASRPAAAQAAVTPPKALPGGLIGYVLLPSIDQTLAHMEKAGARFAPSGAAPPVGMLRMALGQRLGDPELVHLTTSRPLLLAVQQSAPLQAPTFVALLPARDEAYAPMFEALGWKTRQTPQLLIAASTPEGLEDSAGLVQAYQRVEIMAAARADLRLHLETARIVDMYGAFLQMGMEAAVQRVAAATPQASPTPASAAKSGGKAAGKSAGKNADNATAAAPTVPMPPSPEMLKLLKVEMKVFFALLGQTRDVETDIFLDDKALTSDSRITARADTALFDFASMALPQAGSAQKLLGEDGLVRVSCRYDAKQYGAFLSRMAQEIGQDPDVAALVTPETTSLLEAWTENASGDLAYVMGSSKAAPIHVQMAIGIRDEGKALDLTQRSVALLSPGGPWQKILSSSGSGITGAFEKDVRRHAGVPVHRYKMTLDAKALPPQQAAMMKGLLSDVEIAFAGGYQLGAQDPAALDGLIDRALAPPAAAPPALQSEQLFGEGGNAYVDYDIAGLMKALATLAPADAAHPNPFEGLSSSEPMAVRMSARAGTIRFQTAFPMGLFADMAKSAAAARAKVTGEDAPAAH